MQGSMRTAAISSRRWVRVRSRASRSFQGRRMRSSAEDSRWPLVGRIFRGFSRGPRSATVSASMLTFSSSDQPWYWPSNLTILYRPVKARARRRAYITTSVPEF